MFPHIQVLEQIGELLVHCKYGCMPSATEEGKYEVNSAGKKLKPEDLTRQTTVHYNDFKMTVNIFQAALSKSN